MWDKTQSYSCLLGRKKQGRRVVDNKEGVFNKQGKNVLIYAAHLKAKGSFQYDTMGLIY